MNNNILAADIRSRLSCQYELNGAWNLKPQLSRRHSSGNIRRSHAGGKRSKSPVCTGMRIGSDNTLASYDYARLRKNRMLNTRLSLLKIPSKALFPCELTNWLGILRWFDIFIRCKMIRHQNHLILIKYLGCHLPEDWQCHWPCNIICHNYIKLRFNQLSRLNIIQTGMGS